MLNGIRLGLLAMLALCVVLVSCGDDGDPAGPTGNNGGGNTVSIIDNQFVPQVLTVNLGTTVTWTHNGSVVHTVTEGSSAAGSPEFDSGNMTNGDTFTHTFNDLGTVDYYCIPHEAQGMTGQVIVQ